MTRNCASWLIACLLLAATGCETQKSSNPLSPSVAGPIPGVNISVPQVLDPSPGARVEVASQPVKLVVQNASTSGVRPLSYVFEVASDAAFTSVLFTREGIAPGSDKTSVSLSDNLASGRTYYWRARAQDGANAGPYTEAVPFAVYTQVVLQPPVLVSPIGGTVISGRTPTFVFNNVARSGPAAAVGYRLHLALNDSFSAMAAVWEFDEGSNQTSLTAPGALAYGTQYFWRVQATESSGVQSGWSDTQVFSTPAAPVYTPPPGGGGGGGGGGEPINPGSCASSNGDYIASCIAAKYPEKRSGGVSLSERIANMDFLRDRMIEAGICGGMDLAWNRKYNGEITHDGLAWRTSGRGVFVDVGMAYDDTGSTLNLGWGARWDLGEPNYVPYSPRPNCN